MKYIAPELKIESIETQDIILLSGNDNGDGNGNGDNLGGDSELEMMSVGEESNLYSVFALR